MYFRHHGKHKNEMFGNTYILLKHLSSIISWMVIHISTASICSIIYIILEVGTSAIKKQDISVSPMSYSHPNELPNHLSADILIFCNCNVLLYTPSSSLPLSMRCWQSSNNYRLNQVCGSIHIKERNVYIYCFLHNSHDVLSSEFW